MQNGIYTESGGTYGWRLTIQSVTKRRHIYTGTGFKTRIECAHEYRKAVLKYDAKSAYILKDKTFEEQFTLLGVRL